MTREEAAIERGRAVRAAADRPSERRCAELAGSLPVVRAKAKLEIRAGGSDSSVDFSGYASVTDTGYEMYDMFGPYTEMVTAGAFDESLARNDLDVPLVLQHQDLRRIARTTNGSLTLRADDNGLLVEAPNLDMSDHDVAYIVPKLRAGLIDEMSFKFRITSGSWSPDWTEYHIEEADIHRGDVAIVGYGANPHTAGATLRQAPQISRVLITDEDTRIRVAR